MPVGVVVAGNLLAVSGRHFFLRHFPAARCHLNVVRAHVARAHKSLLEHGSDHVSDTPEREQTISRRLQVRQSPEAGVTRMLQVRMLRERPRGASLPWSAWSDRPGAA